MAGLVPAIHVLFRGFQGRRDARHKAGHDAAGNSNAMPAAAHPGRLLKRELTARGLSANRLALDIGVPSGRITDILNGRRSITADTAVRLGRYFGKVAFPGQVGTGWPKETRHLKLAQFWLDLQGQYDIAVVERDSGAVVALSRVRERAARRFNNKNG